MTSFLLSVLLWAQVQAGGTVSGVLRDTNGKPAPTSVIRTLKPHESGVIGMSLAATFTLAP